MHDTADHPAPTAEVETYPRHGLWHNRLHAADGGFLGTYASRDAAVAAARDEARWRRVRHAVLDEAGAVTDLASFA